MWHFITEPGEYSVEIEHVDEETGEVTSCRLPFKEIYNDVHFQGYMWARLITENVEGLFRKE